MFPLLDPASAPRLRGRAQSEAVAVRKAAKFLGEWLRACGMAAPEARRQRFGPGMETLIDLVARTEWLPVVAPAGRVGSDFIARCRKVGARLGAALRVERALLRIGATLDRRVGTAPAGHAGVPALSRASLPLNLASVAATLRPSERARLRSLAHGYRGEPEEGLAPGEVSLPGTRVIVGKSGVLRARAELVGSRIGIGPALTGNPQQLRSVGSRITATARASRQVANALRLLDAAWPAGGMEVRRRTRLVLTLAEPGLVSYSHLHRPGVTYINLRGKSVFDLADDLLHEAAHHRLHAVEEQKPLVRASRGEELRYWSPWRRAMRPVRGIVHSAYTFSFRAELLERMLAAAHEGRGRIGPTRVSAARIAWLRREATAERVHIKSAVADLKDASRKGLLTARGRLLVEEINAAARRSKAKTRTS